MSEPPRILAIDDRPEVLAVIERALGNEYRCELAGSAAEARSHLAIGEFSLALCDIEMPGGSGLDLTSEILSAHPSTAVVMVTGIDDPEIARTAFELGAHGYLVKPFWPGQLLITAMSALRRRELELTQRAHTRALEERLQMLMDRAPVPIYIKDPDRRYLLANRVAHHVAGLEPPALIGLRDADIMPADAEREVARTDATVLECGGSYEAEETLEMGGEKRTFYTVKFPYVDDRGMIAGISGISTDITEKRRAEKLDEELAIARERAIEELRASRQETVDCLALALERHDIDTGLHIGRMARVAALLGELAGMVPEDVLLLRAAAPMHDVGKVATPDAILTKPGPLTEEERMVMEQHTMVGYEILSRSEGELLQMAATIALTHHERWDGQGYPRGLVGEQIPLEGRIVAVADVFDALLSDRPYRRAMRIEEAVALFERERGSHFDPVLVDELLTNLDQALALRE